MSQMLGVSKRTVENRMAEYALRKEEKLTIVYKIMNKKGHTFSKQRTIDDTP